VVESKRLLKIFNPAVVVERKKRCRKILNPAKAKTISRKLIFCGGKQKVVEI